jgi:hypothetical protein
MRAPFTREQFFTVFASYNESVWPMQLLLLALGVFTVAMAIRGPRGSLWAVASLAGASTLNVPEDYGLIVAAIAVVVTRWLRRNQTSARTALAAAG